MSSSAAQTTQTVKLPPIPELFDPDFLDVLLPPQHSEPRRDPAPSNKMMDALRSVAHQKRTENDAPAFSSTLSHTLDAYFGIRQGVTGRKVDRYLANAWAVDPALTLRIIWHCRSIHDGKGEKELFYRFVFLLGVRPLCSPVFLQCIRVALREPPPHSDIQPAVPRLAPMSFFVQQQEWSQTLQPTWILERPAQHPRTRNPR